ncbi:hypothetical protein [Neisseria dumasiana]|uniref:Uncharacterized protein n=1 Tax=Neisseria dumasiana TaxID=1931275 RepID=A0A1X3DMD3_9NEIS|nr:hypothetical protein [Neisseria dumasiana]OSI25050.1 hypothetical protein BV912_01345 [Neisseria dumasiana]
MKVYLALYKGRKSGCGIGTWLARIQDSIIRIITNSSYSHCEIAIVEEVKQYPSVPSVYTCYSSSARDGGVRRKLMSLPSDKWDLIHLPLDVAERVESFYRHTKGNKYDILGVTAFVLPFINQIAGSWFCSEWCACAIGYPNPSQYSPQSLYAAILTQASNDNRTHKIIA